MEKTVEFTIGNLEELKELLRQGANLTEQLEKTLMAINSFKPGIRIPSDVEHKSA